jgi:hypothetical protein
MIDNIIISRIAIIAIMIRMDTCLFANHIRLHAPDLLPETHSQACITAIAHKKYAQMQYRCSSILADISPARA